jgi:uroporphyrinogen-III synthase
MQEVPLDDNEAVFAFADDLLAGRFAAVIFLTGVGATALLEVAERRHDRETMLAALRSTTTIVRGPKPAAVLRDWNVPIALRAPEPNTWADLIAAIDASDLDLHGACVAVQEYGVLSNELHDALRDRGAIVTSVPVYRWTLPDDTAPLEAAIRATVETGFDVLLFTSAQQVRHVLLVAERLGLADAWREALNDTVIASIGPTCSETLQELGLPVDLEPTHPKMGTLVREALQQAPQLLQSKRSL